MPRPDPDDLRQFMDAIARKESGGESDPYRALGPTNTKWGRANGRYQIMSGIWPSWAAEAGYGGLTAQQYFDNPQIQDAIAAHKMSQYYHKYGGRWELVAAAWFGGEGTANKLRDGGMQAVAGISDAKGDFKGTPVPKYVTDVMGYYGGSMSQGGAARLQQANPSVTPEHVQDLTQGNIDVSAGRSPQRQMTQSVMARLSETVQRNPDSEEVRGQVRQALQQMMGKDPGAQPRLTAAQNREPSSAPRPSTPLEEGTTPPTEAPGLGQSGVR